MRRFDAEYLRRTRRGLWDGDRSSLADAALAGRASVLDVGCGTGEFTRVLAEEAPDATVVGLDGDPALLAVAARGGGTDDGGPADERPADGDPGDEDSTDGGASGGPGPATAGDPGPATTGDRRIRYVAGDALSLPFGDDAVEVVACQALLVNLPDPAAALGEFARVAADAVLTVEPDNAAVTVESTVAAEPRLERRARRAYIAGLGVDPTLGAVPGLFREAGLHDVRTRRHEHVRRVAPPYSERALTAARRRATGAGIEGARPTMLAGGLDPEAYDDLRAAWRAMGRSVVDAMGEGDYRRVERVPFGVTVGRVGPSGPGSG